MFQHINVVVVLYSADAPRTNRDIGPGIPTDCDFSYGWAPTTEFAVKIILIGLVSLSVFSWEMALKPRN